MNLIKTKSNQKVYYQVKDNQIVEVYETDPEMDIIISRKLTKEEMKTIVDKATYTTSLKDVLYNTYPDTKPEIEKYTEIQKDDSRYVCYFRYLNKKITYECYPITDCNKIHIYTYWDWYGETHLQQVGCNELIHIPDESYKTIPWRIADLNSNGTTNICPNRLDLESLNDYTHIVKKETRLHTIVYFHKQTEPYSLLSPMELYMKFIQKDFEKACE